MRESLALVRLDILDESVASSHFSRTSTRHPPHMREWKGSIVPPRSAGVGTAPRPTSTTTALCTATYHEEVRVQRKPGDAHVDCHGKTKVHKVFEGYSASLVRDGALPPAFGEAFSGLEQTSIIAADRKGLTASRVSNLQASGWLRERNKQAALTTKLEKAATDQFFLEADEASRRFRAKRKKRKQVMPNGRSGLSSWDRCWRPHPRTTQQPAASGSRPQRSKVEVQGEEGSWTGWRSHTPKVSNRATRRHGKP